jgi:O-methyltransferase involved in polyketide biosynthesis
VRARESQRDDRLFDPYAQAFADAAPGAFPEMPQTGEQRAALGPLASVGAAFYARAVIRTRFFDDYLAAAADLREDWAAALTGAGFDRARPAAWLAEGLLLYLTAQQAGRLLTGVSELSAPGSRLAFEHDPEAAAALAGQARQTPALRPYASLWKGGLGGDASRWLAGHGGQPRSHDLAAVAACYGRPVPGPARGSFLTAVRPGPSLPLAGVS